VCIKQIKQPTKKNHRTKINEAHKWNHNPAKRKPKADPAEVKRHMRKRGEKAKVMARRRKTDPPTKPLKGMSQ